MSLLPNQPQTISEVLDHGFRLYVKTFKIMAPIALGMSILWFLPSLVVDEDMLFKDGAFNFQGFGLLMGGTTMLNFVSSLFFIAMIHRVDGYVNQDSRGLGAALLFGLKRLIPAGIAMLIYMIAVVFGLALLIVPGIFVSVLLVFNVYAIALDGSGPLTCLRRSARLIYGNWWRTVLVLTVLMIIYMIISSVLSFGYFMVMFTQPPETWESYTIWVDIASIFVGIATYPLMVALMYSLYVDLRVRREGGDLEARLEQMA